MRTLLAAVATAAVLGVAAGCGAAEEGATPVGRSTNSSSSAATTSGPATVPSPSSNAVIIEVSIAGGQVEPPPARVDVRQGQTVRITVTSDEADEVHVHGYDIEVELAPSEPRTVDLVADQIGLFDVETHEQGMQLFQLVVR